MATFVKFSCFAEDLPEKVHDLGSDALKVLLTDTAPSTADTLVDTDATPCVVQSTSAAVEIAAGFGYSKGGATVTITSSSQTAGLYKLIGDDVTITAAGGDIGPFRYAVLYNNSSKTSATRAPIGCWDYGSSITLLNGESIVIDFSAIEGILQIVFT